MLLRTLLVGCWLLRGCRGVIVWSCVTRSSGGLGILIGLAWAPRITRLMISRWSAADRFSWADRACRGLTSRSPAGLVAGLLGWGRLALREHLPLALGPPLPLAAEASLRDAFYCARLWHPGGAPKGRAGDAPSTWRIG